MKFHGQGMIHLLTAFAVTLIPLRAASPAEAPSLSVHEKAYGTRTINGHPESIQELEIRIVSHTPSAMPFVVECFFLKRGKKGSPHLVDDTVIFEVTNPHATYEVEAKPIALHSTASKPSSKNKGHSGGTKTKTPEVPREGWVVRVLQNGSVLRQHCSAHAVESLLEEDPELLTRAVSSRSVRRPESGELLKVR